MKLLDITTRFVGSDGSLYKALLELCELPKGHAGDECAPRLLNTKKTSGFLHNVGYITLDSASSNDTMIEALSQLLESEGYQ